MTTRLFETPLLQKLIPLLEATVDDYRIRLDSEHDPIDYMPSHIAVRLTRAEWVELSLLIANMGNPVVATQTDNEDHTRRYLWVKLPKEYQKAIGLFSFLEFPEPDGAVKQLGPYAFVFAWRRSHNPPESHREKLSLWGGPDSTPSMEIRFQTPHAVTLSGIKVPEGV